MKKMSAWLLTGILTAGTLFAGCTAAPAKSEATAAQTAASEEAEVTPEAAAQSSASSVSFSEEGEEGPTQQAVETPEVTEAATPVEETEMAVESAETAEATEADPYVGSYTGNGAVIMIDRDGETYYVQVRWSIDETNSAEWTMSGSFDANGTLTYSNATKVATVTDETDASTSEEVYTQGSGSITVQNGVLTWSDNQEGIATGITYTKS